GSKGRHEGLKERQEGLKGRQDGWKEGAQPLPAFHPSYLPTFPPSSLPFLPSCPSAFPPCRLAVLSRPAVLSSRLRQQQREGRALAGRRLYFDVAVVHLDGTINHRETDSAALLLGGEIQIENPLQVLGVDAHTRVAHADPHAAAARRLAG